MAPWLLAILATVGRAIHMECDDPADLWQHVRYLDQEVAAVSPMPPQARRELYDFYHILAASEEARKASALRCARGTAAILLHSLPLLEKDEGRAAAGKAYHAAIALLEEVAHLPREHWDIDLRHHEAVPRLLGLGQRRLPEPALCHGGGGSAINRSRTGAGSAVAGGVGGGRRPHIFVYDTGDYAQPVLICAAGMEGVEVLLHQFFLQSSCRTLDPAAADYFYVPFYSFCYQNLHIAPGEETRELDRHNLAVVASLPFFDPHRRHQHIFHFPHEFWDFPSWEKHVARSIIFAVEASPILDVENYTHCPSCFDVAKDVVVPGHTDLWAVRRLREFNVKSAAQRRHTFCFHGSAAHDLYERTRAPPPFNGSSAASTRKQIGALRFEPDGSVGGHITPVVEYYRKVGDCRFCLVPKGVGFTNGRLLESFFSGCIPVILSDAMVVPFQSLIPWPDFSIKAPMGDVLAVVQRLRSLPLERVESMKASLEAHACWFDFYSDDPDCSPYQGILLMLKAHHDRRKIAGFWMPPVAQAGRQ